MDIADELKTYLSQLAPLASLIGSGTAARVFHNRARQARPTPYLCIEENAGEVIDLLADDSRFAQTTFAIFHYGSTRSEANQLANVVRENLHTFQGYMGAIWVAEVAMPQFRSTSTWQPVDNSEAFLFETLQLYDFWHNISGAWV